MRNTDCWRSCGLLDSVSGPGSPGRWALEASGARLTSPPQPWERTAWTLAGIPRPHPSPAPHSAGVGLANQILSGSHLSTSDQAQTWPEDSEFLPGEDSSMERFMVKFVYNSDVHFFSWTWGSELLASVCLGVKEGELRGACLAGVAGEGERAQLLVSACSSSAPGPLLHPWHFSCSGTRSKLGIWMRHSLGAANLPGPGQSQDPLAPHLLLSVWPSP